MAQAIEFNLQNFWRASAALGLSKTSLIETAQKAAHDYPDCILEEIRAISRGANLDVRELLAFNLCQGLVAPDECTVLFAMADATSAGKTLFLKNSDKIGAGSMVGPQFYQHKEINVVLSVRDRQSPAFIGVSSAGSTGLKMGVNEFGVAAGTNIARTVELGKRAVDTTQMRALDRVQLAREGLAKETALEAALLIAARVTENPTATPGNLEFVDARTGFIIEGSYDRVAVQTVKNGIASRSNSFQVLRELNNPGDVSSYCRYVRTQELLESVRGRLTPELMKQFSQDHANGPGPNSICRHGSHYEEETSQSAMVVEIDPEKPKKTRFWIALGKPCHAWVNSEGWVEGSMDKLDWLPEGFLNGDTWKRFWTEEPNLKADSDLGLAAEAS
ncbi:MAG: hypothetical protein HY645_15505 [Acidobacteria bacterium]|nr:hypothetical protein [Acidobacteriota bacterium]